MGKKGTKRKIQWRTLSITEDDEEQFDEMATTNGRKYFNSSSNNNCTGLHTDQASATDDKFKYSGTNFSSSSSSSYLHRNTSFSSCSSNLNNYNNNNLNIHNSNNNTTSSDNSSNCNTNNNNINNNNSNNIDNLNYNDNKIKNEPNRNSYNCFYKQHNDTKFISSNNSSSTININTANNNYDRINSSDNELNNNHYNRNNHRYSSSRYTFRRRPYLQQSSEDNLRNNSTKYRSASINRSNKSLDSSSLADKENDYKPLFNEDDYTRITTPRQDVIFKKGYFSRPRYMQSVSTPAGGSGDATSSTAASIVSNEESSMSATSVPSSLSPEQCSSSQHSSDSMTDHEPAYIYNSYVDQNGIVYVNPYLSNGYDHYTGQIFMMPYGYPPYNMCLPKELNASTMHDNHPEEEENNAEQDIGSINDEENEPTIGIDAKEEIIVTDDSKTDNCEENKDDEIVSPENTNEVIAKNEDEKSDKEIVIQEDEIIEPPADHNIENQYLPNIINYAGYPGQYFPPIFYPVNLIGGPPQIMPIIASNYDGSINTNDDGDAEDSDPSVDCMKNKQNCFHRENRHITTINNSSSTDCSEEDSNELTDILDSKQTSKIESDLNANETEEISLQNNNDDTSKEIIDNQIDDSVKSSTTQETEIKQIKFNANVDEFKPRNHENIVKPHLNVNVKEFHPRNYRTNLSPFSSLSGQSEIVNNSTVNQSVLKTEEINIKSVKMDQIKPESKSKDIEVKKSNEDKLKKLSTVAGNGKNKLIADGKKKPEEIVKLKVQDRPKKNAENLLTKNLTNNRNQVKKKSLKSEINLPANQTVSKNTSTATTTSPISPIKQPNNVLSYAQIVNKDLKPSTSSTDDTTATLNSPDVISSSTKSSTDVDSDLEMLLKSIEAADKVSKAQDISWQTVKPRGKRGKLFKEPETENFHERSPSPVELQNNDTKLNVASKKINTPEKTIKLTPPNVPDQKDEIVEQKTDENDVESESQNDQSTNELKSSNEKKKSKSRSKKISKKLNLSPKIKIKEKKSIPAPAKPFEDEASGYDKNASLSGLLEEIENEIKLTLDTSIHAKFENDQDIILAQLFSPSPKSPFARNSLDVINGDFDYKYKTPTILKEEEEMVLNVMKSLSSSSSASPITGRNPTLNVFNNSFIEALGTSPQSQFTMPGLKKTSISGRKKDSTNLNDLLLETLIRRSGGGGGDGLGNEGECSRELSGKIPKLNGNRRMTNKNMAKPFVGKEEISKKNPKIQETTESASPEIVEQSNANESDYIKNCIHESYNWISKSNMPSTSKSIVDDFESNEDEVEKCNDVPTSDTNDQCDLKSENEQNVQDETKSKLEKEDNKSEMEIDQQHMELNNEAQSDVNHSETNNGNKELLEHQEEEYNVEQHEEDRLDANDAVDQNNLMLNDMDDNDKDDQTNNITTVTNVDETNGSTFIEETNESNGKVEIKDCQIIENENFSIEEKLPENLEANFAIEKINKLNEIESAYPKHIGGKENLNGFHHNGHNGSDDNCILKDNGELPNGHKEILSATLNGHLEETAKPEEKFEHVVPHVMEINTNVTPLNLVRENTIDSNDDIIDRNRLNSTSSSTSLEVQLKLLQEQLMKFDEITINSPDSIDNAEKDCENCFQSPLSCSASISSASSSSFHLDLKNTNEQDEHFCDNNLKLQTNNNKISKRNSPNRNLFPLERQYDDDLIKKKFPLTEAVRLWLNAESKENSPEPLLRIPSNPILCSKIRSSLNENHINNDDDDDDDNDSWTSTSDYDDDKENDINEKCVQNSKNLISNPLHVSSVKQHDDDKITCERVAKNFSELLNTTTRNKNDLLDYWDNEFIENPKKWLKSSQQKYNSHLNSTSSSSSNSNNCQDRSRELSSDDSIMPYESVYGKSINYDQLLSNNNYEFLSNNIINYNNDKNKLQINRNNLKNLVNDDDDDDNDDNNDDAINELTNQQNDDDDDYKKLNENFDNIKTRNFNDKNCLKPPEVCCILM